MSHRGTIAELRAAVFASKEAARVKDAQATPEEKLEMLESMQELADELRRSGETLAKKSAQRGQHP